MRKLLTIWLLLCGAAFAQYGGDKSNTIPASGGGSIVCVLGGGGCSNTTFWGVEGGSSPQSIAAPASNTAGNEIIAAMCSYAGSTGSGFAMTDSRNSYTQHLLFTNGSTTCAIYNALNIGAGANTLSCADSGGPAYLFCAAVEVSGLSTSSSFDQSADAAIGTTTAFDSGASGTTATAKEFLFGVMYNQYDNYTYTPGVSYTSLGEASSGSGPDMFDEFQIVSSTGAYHATATSSLSTSSANMALLATFK
jgi:hypothetical protein